MRKLTKITMLALIAGVTSSVAQESDLDAFIIQSPALQLEEKPEENADIKIQDPETMENQELVSGKGDNQGKSRTPPRYKRYAPAKIPGYTLRALDETKRVRFNIEGQRVEVEVPILIYMPDDDGIIEKSGDITNKLGQEILEVISENSASIAPKAKNELTDIAVGLNELSTSLKRATPTADEE